MFSMTAFISPFAYEEEFLELNKLRTRDEHNQYVSRTLGAADAALDKVVRVYLALRGTMPGSMREDCETSEEELQCEQTLVETCCTIHGDQVKPHVADMVRIGRLRALCHVGVLAHLLLFHECPVEFVKWMCEQARVKPSLPMFEFKLHALALADSVQKVEKAQTDISTLCTDRDMCALQLYCHDLLAHLERKGMLHVDNASEGSRIEDIVRAVYGCDLAFKALGYCSLTRTPFYDSEGGDAITHGVARRFTPRDWYRVVVNYGRHVIVPGAPLRKRARR